MKRQTLGYLIVIVMLLPILSIMMGANIDVPSIPEAEASVTTRGECHEKTDYQNNTLTFTTGLPCFVNAGTVESPNYQPFIIYEGLSFSDDEYRIGNTRVGYSVWKSNGSVTFWNSDNFVDVKVRQETWKVYYYDESATAWVDTEIDDDSPSIVFTTNTTHNKVSITKSNSEGVLKVDYILMAGKPLKHDVYWTNNAGETREYKVIQSWYDIVDADRVKHVAASNATAYYYFAGQALKTQAQVGTNFIFEDSSGNLIIDENQGSASMYFSDVLFIRSNGIESVEFNFNNQTTLADGGTFVIDPSTLDAEPRLSADGHSGIYLPQQTAGGTDCLRAVSDGRPTWYQDEAHGIMQIGGEDSSRCYVQQMMYDVGDICDGASDGGSAPFECDGIYVSKVEFNFPVTSDSEMVSYCNDDPCTTRIKITMLSLAKHKGTGMCGDNAAYGSGSANTVHRLAQATGNDGVLNAGAADMVLNDQNPLSTADAWSGNSIELNGNGSYAIDLMHEDLRDSSGDQESCFGFSEVGNPQIGQDSGSGSHQFWRINFPTLTVTYSTSPPVSYYDTQIDLMMFDDSTNVTMGDPEVRFASRNGTLSAWTNCTKTIASGTVGVCHLSTDSVQSGDIRMWVRWAGNGETCSSCKGLKIEGKDSYNFTAATMMLKLQVSIYKNITLHFHDNVGVRNTPQNFTMKSGHNASDKTVTFADESSKGAVTIGYTTNGTSGSENRGGSPATAADRGTAVCVTLKTCNQMRKIYELGDARNANNTVYFNVTADNQVVSFRQKVYVANLDFVSMDYVLNLDTKVTSLSYSLPNGTVGDVFRPAATSAGVGAHSMQIGNDSLTLTAARFQGKNLIRNSTAFIIGSNGVSGNRGGSFDCMSDNLCTAEELTHLIQLQYYKQIFHYQSNDKVLKGITPTDMRGTAANGSSVTISGAHAVGGVYLINGTQTVTQVNFLGDEVFLDAGGDNATSFSITVAANTCGGPSTSGSNLKCSFTLNLFNIVWNAFSEDDQLKDIQADDATTQIKYTAPNGTLITQTAHFTGSYITGGSLVPRNVTYQGVNVVKNDTAITIDTDETHGLKVKVYKIGFDFTSDDLELDITPSNFTYTLYNGTVGKFSFADTANSPVCPTGGVAPLTGCYFAAQPIVITGQGGVSPMKGAIEFESVNVRKNATQYTPTDNEVIRYRITYYNVNLKASLGATHADASNPGIVYYQITATNGTDLGKIASDSQGKLSAYFLNGTLQYRVWWRGGLTDSTLDIIIFESPTDELASTSITAGGDVNIETDAIAISGEGDLIGVIAINRTDITSYSWIQEGRELRLGEITINPTTYSDADIQHTMMLMNVSAGAYGQPTQLVQTGIEYGSSAELWLGLFSDKVWAFSLETGIQTVTPFFTSSDSGGSGGAGGGGGGAGPIDRFLRLVEPIVLDPLDIAGVGVPIRDDEKDFIFVELGAFGWEIPISGLGGAAFASFAVLITVFAIGTVSQIGDKKGKPTTMEGLFSQNKKKRQTKAGGVFGIA